MKIRLFKNRTWGSNIRRPYKAFNNHIYLPGSRSCNGLGETDAGNMKNIYIYPFNCTKKKPVNILYNSNICIENAKTPFLIQHQMHRTLYERWSCIIQTFNQHYYI